MSHELATELMDVRALWEVYAASPPEIRGMLPLSPAPAPASNAKTVVIRVRPPLPIPARVRTYALTAALLGLAAWGGFVATSRAARRVSAVPAQVAAAPARARTLAVPAPARPVRAEPPIAMTIELPDDVAIDLPGSPVTAAAATTPAVRRAAPKKFRVANDVDMAAAARANQASQLALDSSLK